MHSACMITQHIPLVLPKSDTMCAGTKPQNSEYDSIHCSQLCSTYFPGLVLQHIFSCSWALWSSIPHTIPLTFACFIGYEGTHYAHMLLPMSSPKFTGLARHEAGGPQVHSISRSKLYRRPVCRKQTTKKNSIPLL